MRETIHFYAPDWDLVLIWGVVALVAFLLVLWMGRLFGWTGALVTPLVIAVVAAGLWVAAGPWGLFYYIAFSLPLTFGALAGMGIWYVWLGRKL